ncbi:MAG TPA: histidine kinase, partial [bacterium]|nr:histidine kinase [bacterium]
MKPRPDSSRRLRARAERIAKSRPPASAPSTKAEIIEELRIHQVELELQVEELRRTEQELQKTRDRFVALYEEAPVGYLTLDGSNFITRVNRAAVDLLGSSRSARASRPFTAHLDNTSRSTFYAVAAEVRQSFDRRSFDALLALAGRKPVWVELTLAAEPPGPELRVTMVDVTRQKNAERQLRELAERLISVQEIERASVASALHDDSGQQLTYLCILLEQAREGAAPAVVARMDEALEVARKVLEEIRRLSTSLSPAEIGRVGLLRAVQSMVNEFSTRTRIPVVFQPLG